MLLSRADTLTGTPLNDNFNALAGGDTLSGLGGNDYLYGGAGSDRLLGGVGNDVLAGGTERDFFQFAEFGNANADVIADFNPGTGGSSDRIELVRSVFTSLPLGTLPGGNFVANATGTATAVGHYVVYNNATGQLYYDADGNGAGAAQLIATLTGAPTLVPGNFIVI